MSVGPIRVIALVGLVSALLGAPGCQSDQPNRSSDDKPRATASPQAAPVRQTSGGSYYVSYKPIPDPIPLNRVFAMEVRVCRDEAMSVPAEDVAVVADAAMPHHHHGMNLVPRAERTGAGTFRVNGMLFHMPGYWEIYIDVKAGGKDERARFEVEIQ